MKKIVTIAIILLLNLGGWAQESEQYALYQAKIKNLEKQIDSLNEKIKQLDINYSVKEREIKKYVQDEYSNWLTVNASFIFWFTGILGFLGVGVFIKNLVTREVKRKIQFYLNNDEWTNALKTKINKQLDQNKLKLKTKICVLSNGFEKEMSTFLHENEFPNVNYHQFSGDLNIDSNVLKNGIQIVILNNQDNQFGFKTVKLESGATVPDESTPVNNLIDLIKKSYPALAIFYFNDNGVVLPRKLNSGLISSFANSYASLYHNLLDLMRYKYLVIDRRSL